MKTELTREQSAHLIELGVSADKASMCMLDLDYDSEVIPREDVWEECGRLLANVNDEVIDVDRKIVSKDSDFDHSYENDNPIFTLADVIAMLPKGIIYEGLSCKLRITSWYDEPYFAGYENQIGKYIMGNPYDAPFSAEELIDALFDLLLWAIGHGHIDLTK